MIQLIMIDVQMKKSNINCMDGKVMMRIRHAMIPVILLGFLFFAAGCKKHNKYTPESINILDVATQVSGGNLRLMSITSTEYYFKYKENEVRPRLEAAVNSGKYNITSVKTSYSSGYLTAAEVKYDASGPGDGNEIRVMFIHSDEYYWKKKAADIKPRLDSVVNSGEYDIIKINTVYAEGYLLAAEVYYREKRETSS